MSAPAALANWPAVNPYTSANHEFNKISDLSDFEWSGVGHVPPVDLTDQAGGAVTLGSGAAVTADFMQAQAYGSSIKLNRLGKTYRFLYKLQLSSATLCFAMCGPCITNTSLNATNITDGLGFYNIGSGWNAFVAWNSATQYTTYTQQLNIQAASTSEITLGIQIVTDGVTTGAGSVSWWANGVQVGYTASSAAAWLPHDELLRSSFGMANGSGVAQTMIVSRHAYSDQT